MTLTPFRTTLSRATHSRTLAVGAVAGVGVALLVACGGGDGTDSPNTTPKLPDLLVSHPYVTTPVHVGVEVRFGGGGCSGGDSNLTATWTFGDGSASSTTGVHTYQTAGQSQVRVECRDTSGLVAPAWTFVDVLP